MVKIGFDGLGLGKIFKFLFLPCSKLPERRASPLPSALMLSGSSILNHCSREGWGGGDQPKERAELAWMDGIVCARTEGSTRQSCPATEQGQTQDHGQSLHMDFIRERAAD